MYVQHIIPQHARHLAAAISSGACIIVCGAANQMPKAVFAAFSEALSTGLDISMEGAEEILQGVYIAPSPALVMTFASKCMCKAWSARSVT